MLSSDFHELVISREEIEIKKNLLKCSLMKLRMLLQKPPNPLYNVCNTI